jgi:hypothetical protein
MVRKYKTEGRDVLEVGDVAGLMLIYGPKLQSQFTVVEETEHWVLWHRNGSYSVILSSSGAMLGN